jgi:hypothetical protein
MENYAFGTTASHFGQTLNARSRGLNQPMHNLVERMVYDAKVGMISWTLGGEDGMTSPDRYGRSAVLRAAEDYHDRTYIDYETGEIVRPAPAAQLQNFYRNIARMVNEYGLMRLLDNGG